MLKGTARKGGLSCSKNSIAFQARHNRFKALWGRFQHGSDRRRGADRSRWPSSCKVVPMESPYCSCKLTRCGQAGRSGRGGKVSHCLQLPSLWVVPAAAVS